jgi:hypothetical protein
MSVAFPLDQGVKEATTTTKIGITTFRTCPNLRMFPDMVASFSLSQSTRTACAVDSRGYGVFSEAL